jgi:methionyl aminopeptidase
VIELRTPAEIERMKPAGRFVADVLVRLEQAADVGVNLLELDALAHEMIRERGAESCYIDYHPSFGAMPFGKVLCTSVADSAVSLVVGTPAQQDLDLIDTARRALDAGIEAACVGHRIGDISAAIASVAHAEGLSINTDFGGHGVGRTMHGDPHVPNNGRPGRGYPLKPGLVIAIEPWFLQSTDVLWTDPDGWTLRSGDGSRGAHMEHTIAITDDGPLVLTSR